MNSTQTKTREEVLDFLLTPIDVAYKRKLINAPLRRFFHQNGANIMGQAAAIPENLFYVDGMGNVSRNSFKYLLRGYGLRPGVFWRQVKLFDTGQFGLNPNSPDRAKVAEIAAEQLEGIINGKPVLDSVVDEDKAQIVFNIDAAAFENDGLSLDFVQSVLNQPQASDAVINLIRGFAMAAKNAEHGKHALAIPEQRV